MDESLTKKKAVGWVFATVLAPLLIAYVLSVPCISFWYYQTGHQGQPPGDVIMRVFMDVAAPALWATIALWWLIHRKTSSFAELFATRTGSFVRDLPIGLGLGALWVVIYGLWVVPFGEMFVIDLAKLRSIPASLSAGFCEEFLFRGFVFLVIARAGGGWKSQVVYSSLAFGAAHLTWGPWGMAWTVVLGFTFGAARLWCGNVWPAVVAHTLLDLCIEPGLIEKAATMSRSFG